MAISMPSKVYFIETSNSDPAGLISEKLAVLIEKSRVLNYIGKSDFTAVKIHFGEEGNTGYILPEWVKMVAGHLKTVTENAFLTDSNVLYKNSKRANTVDHLKLADKHGFSLHNTGLPILISDGVFGRNYTEVPIGKKHFDKVKVASDIASADSILALSHVTGHFATGIGGAIKNVGMGCASRRGKYEQHSGVVPEVNSQYCVGCGSCMANCPASCIRLVKGTAMISKKDCIGCGECVVVCKTKALNIKWSETLENLQEKMVEYAYGAVKAVRGKVGYVSFLVNITKNCDCMAFNEPRIVDDFGILASADPVAIDKAAVDIINRRASKDLFKIANPETMWLTQLKYAEEIGMGSLNYELENVGYG